LSSFNLFKGGGSARETDARKHSICPSVRWCADVGRTDEESNPEKIENSFARRTKEQLFLQRLLSETSDRQLSPQDNNLRVDIKNKQKTPSGDDDVFLIRKQ